MARKPPELTEDDKAFLADAGKTKEDLRAKIEQVKREVASLFSERVQYIFNAFPHVEHVTWNQYTPSWCDGEQCSFHNGARCPSINTEHTEESAYPTSVPRELQARTDAVILTFLNSFSDDDMQDMFGDPVTVKVSRTGIELDTFDVSD